METGTESNGGGGWELGDKRTRTGRKMEGNWEKRGWEVGDKGTETRELGEKQSGRQWQTGELYSAL